MCFITPLVSHMWGMNSSPSWGAERNILGINMLVVALLRWLRWGGRQIILPTARIRFVVSRKDEFLLRLPPCCGRNEVASGCESSRSGCRGWGLFPRRARVGGWAPVQPWGGGGSPLPVLPPHTWIAWDLWGERMALLQWGPKRDRMKLNL